MIVNTFTEKELFDEIKKDMSNIISISDKKNSKVERIVKKSSLFPVLLHSFVTTDRKNKWMIIWEAKTKKYVGENSLITLVCYQQTSRGIFAYMPSFVQGKIILLVYPPHFFSRYAKRMNIDLSGLDLIRRFFERNASSGFTYNNEQITESAYQTNVYGSTTEGVGMGVKSANNDIFLIKTFVSYDMLKGEQIETFAKSEKLRQEIHEKIMMI